MSDTWQTESQKRPSGVRNDRIDAFDLIDHETATRALAERGPDAGRHCRPWEGHMVRLFGDMRVQTDSSC